MDFLEITRMLFTRDPRLNREDIFVFCLFLAFFLTAGLAVALFFFSR